MPVTGATPPGTSFDTGGHESPSQIQLYLLDQVRQLLGGGVPVVTYTRATTTRNANYTIPTGFQQASIVWLGGGSGVIDVDGIPYDASQAHQVIFNSVDSGTAVNIVANSNTYYVTEVR